MKLQHLWHVLHRRAALWASGLVLVLLGGLGAAPAWAQDADPPGRVGRLADFNGSVSWWDDETGQWADAKRNRPLTGGDRVSTAASGRAELRVGSSVLRLGNDSELEVLRLDDERMVFQLHSGSLALRVRSREIADEVELVTAEARLLPQREGHYRLDRTDDLTRAGAWRGMLRIGDADGPLVGEGQRVELYREAARAGDPGLRQAWVRLPDDGFAAWVLDADAQEGRVRVAEHVSPEMTGAEDLDRHGRWETHPEYGALWLPLVVAADWAPYRYGRWSWVAPWGWTWIDDAPWGFAPFHYGRWVHWRDRWGWVPGAYVPRPVYAPALVAWVGGSGWGVSIHIGGPTVGWLPLAPREPYRPHYRSTPRYIERVNPAPPYRWKHPPQQVPTGPISYGNQGVPRGVTVVPRDVLLRREPVQRGVVDLPRRPPREAVSLLPPPSAPERLRPERRPLPDRSLPDRSPADRLPPRDGAVRVVPVPGGAQPAPVPVPATRPALPREDWVGDRRDDRRTESRDDRRTEPREDRRDFRRDEGRETGREAVPARPGLTQPAPMPPRPMPPQQSPVQSPQAPAAQPVRPALPPARPAPEPVVRPMPMPERPQAPQMAPRPAPPAPVPAMRAPEAPRVPAPVAEPPRPRERERGREQENR